MEPRDARCWDHCRVPHPPNPRTCVGMSTTALSPLPLREGRHCPHHSPWNELSVAHTVSMVWAAKLGSPPTSSCQEEEGKALLGFEDRGGLCLPSCGERSRHSREFRWCRPNSTAQFLVASFLRAKRWEQPKYPSADEWINNIPYIHKMDCYSAMKKNQVQATTWTNLENIIKDARHKGPLIL